MIWFVHLIFDGSVIVLMVDDLVAPHGGAYGRARERGGRGEGGLKGVAGVDQQVDRQCEDFAWATACQSARALHEFEEERNRKQLPYDLVLMRALNIGLCDTFIGIGSESGVAKKTSNDQQLVSTIGTHLWLRQERQYDMVRPPDLRWICHRTDG